MLRAATWAFCFLGADYEQQTISFDCVGTTDPVSLLSFATHQRKFRALVVHGL